MAIHNLKCWPEQFEKLRLRVKRAEVRREGEHSFHAGDVLFLWEWDPYPRGSQAPGTYTGRGLSVAVTDLLRLSETPSPWGLQGGGGIVVMSLRVLQAEKRR